MLNYHHIQCFSSSQFCGVATLANHSQEELTKFGYKSENIVETFKNLSIFFNPYSKYGDFRKQIPTKLMTLVHFFHKNPLNCTGVLFLPSSKNSPPKKRFMNVSLFFCFIIFFCWPWPTKAPRQGYCVYIHYRVSIGSSLMDFGP